MFHLQAGWGYEEVLPYFLRSEGQADPTLAATRYHGTAGPLSVAPSRFRRPIADAFAVVNLEDSISNE